MRKERGEQEVRGRVHSVKLVCAPPLLRISGKIAEKRRFELI